MASLCIGTSNSAATAASSAAGMTVPTSLLAHMTETSATSSWRVSTSRSAAADTEPSAAVGSQVTSAPSSSTGPIDALDRQVVALGTARGEDDLRGTGPQPVGDQLTGFLDAAPRRPAAGVQRGGVAQRAQHSRHRLDCGGVHRGSGGVIQVDHDATHDTGPPVGSGHQ